MEKYIKCPRCELNYILEKQKFCDVCKAELKLAPDIYSEEDEDAVLCPICKINYIYPDEDMCSTCRDNGEELALIDEDIDNDEEWRAYLDDEKEAVITTEDGVEIVPLAVIAEAETFDDDDEDEEVYSYSNNKKDDDDVAFEDAYDYDDNFDDEDEDEDDEDEDK